ncbi:GAF domain-containing SpoIIE family protein phosphatase [Spirillospora sp. NPDC127200]
MALEQVAARLAEVDGLEQMLVTAVEAARPCLGPVGGMLAVRDLTDRTLSVAALHEAPESLCRIRGPLQMQARLPVTDAVRTGRPVWIDGAADRAARYPALAGRAPESFACGSLPLQVHGRVWGVLCLIRFGSGDAAPPDPFNDVERRFIRLLADRVATAPALSAANAAPLSERPCRTAPTGDLSAALATAATVPEFAAAVAKALPVFGANGILVVERSGDRMRVLASAGHTERTLRRVRRFPLAVPAPLTDALARRTPVFADSPAALLARYPLFQPVVNRSQARAWAALPLPSSHGAPAACLLDFSHSRHIDSGQQAQLLMTAGLLAQALDRCRIRDAEHHLVQQVQERMLPGSVLGCGLTLAHTAGLDLAYRYRPASFGLQVGGDFYDVIPLPDGLIALVIGDVQGHNVHAAALMGQIRIALRAYAVEGHPPDQVMARTNHLLDQLNTRTDDPLLVTCLYLVLDRRGGTVRGCCAGHPHPVLLPPGEPAQLMKLDIGLPLGVATTETYPVTTVALPPAGTLLLYTDGLVEDHPNVGVALDGAAGDMTGEDALLAHLDEFTRAGPHTAQQLLDALPRLGMEVPLPDDIAVLAARLQP